VTLPDKQASAPPFFIVGCRRSGTTLLRLMLDRHPGIAIPPESHFIPPLWKHRRRYGSDGRLTDVDRFLSDLGSQTRFRLWGLPIEAVRSELDRTGEPTIDAGLSASFRAYARREGKQRWGDKTPNYVEHLSTLDRLFPGAQFIHLVRDGRDVAASMLAMQDWHHTAATPAFYWRQALQQVRAARPVLGKRLVEVRYEALIEDTDAELRGLCTFLGVDFDPAMLESDWHEIEKVPEAERHMHGRVGLPVTSGLRDWRRDLDRASIREFEAIAGRELHAYGYELSGPSPDLRSAMRARGHLLRFGVGTLPRRIRTYTRARLEVRGNRAAPVQQPMDTGPGLGRAE